MCGDSCEEGKEDINDKPVESYIQDWWQSL